MVAKIKLLRHRMNLIRGQYSILFDARGNRARLDQSPANLNVFDFKNTVHVRLMLLNDMSHTKINPNGQTIACPSGGIKTDN